jgi:hypothetical protein
MRAAALAVMASAAVLTGPAAAHAAEALYGVTDDNRLVRFDSDAPGDVTSGVTINGLGNGENVVGVDVRPANDHIYVTTTANRILQVNPTTGATRVFSSTPALTGALFGVDFNPVSDALRIVSDAEQNLRVVFPAGTGFTEAPLQYAAGDAGAGTNPTVTASAYTNSAPDATTTTLYGIDVARDVLVRQDPPNAGTLTTVGPLGFDASDAAGFDVAVAGNTAYAAITRQGVSTPELYRIDLNTGAATAATSAPAIRAGSTLRGIAAAGTVSDDKGAPSVSLAFSSTILEQNTNTLRPSISCDESCTLTVTASIDGRRGGTATERITGGAGRETVEVRLDAVARKRIARRGTELIVLSVTGTDAAGNRTTLRRESRTQTLAQRRS